MKLKMRFSFIIFAFCLLFTCVLFAQEQENILILSEEDKAFIREHPIITVIYQKDKMPYSWYDISGDYPVSKGISLNLLQEAASRLGFNLQFSPKKVGLENAFFDNNIDISVSPIVADGVYKTELYSTHLYLVSKDEKKPKGENVILTSLTEEEVSALSPLPETSSGKYKFVNNAEEFLRLFKKKSYNFAIVNQFELEALSKEPGWTARLLNTEQTQTFYFSSEDLANLFSKAFASFNKDDFLSGINLGLNDWNSSIREKKLRRSVFTHVLAVSLILMILLLFGMATILMLVARHNNKNIEFDEVTGMPTFSKFKHDVRRILKKASPDEFMLISLNIADFRYINYNFGFSKGNMLLLELSQHFRTVKFKNEYICRFHADNFVFFLRTQSLQTTEEHVAKLIDVDDHIKNFLPEKYKLHFSSSVYYIDDPTQDVINMIDKANLARKSSIGNTSSQVIEYTKQMDDSINWNKEITLSMNNAFENKEFEVYYQPKVSFKDSKIIGAEALIRWNNPEHGLLSPIKFVPLFEQNGFIQRIDLFVFDSVCRFLVEWNHSSKDGTCPCPLTISFNLSRSHLHNPELLKELTDIKKKYSISPSHIEVELTETIMFDDPKRLIKVMNEIKQAGFSISVDDFGSGYSSLNLLKDIPADVLKLDKEFLSNIPGNQKESMIIASVIEMSKKLNLTIVAEGVETESQVELLRNMGCDIAQGYFYSKPVPEKEYFQLLKESYL